MSATRAPWKYEPETKTIRAMPENYWLATMDSWDGMPDHEANARLIAAAPEMLALLRRWSETTCDHGAQDFCPREDARALLAKVERSA